MVLSAPLLFTPSSPVTGLVVMLHGCTQDSQDFARGTRLHEWALPHGLAVLYPEQSEQRNSRRCWNWFVKDQQQLHQGEPWELAQLTLQTCQQLGVSKAYIGGLSAGGAMAALTAHLYPQLFRALAVHSGLAPRVASGLVGALAAMRGVSLSRAPKATLSLPTLVFQGQVDKVVHPSNASRIAQAVLAGYPSTLELTSKESGPGYQLQKYERQLEVWHLEQLGHAWSGGSPEGSYTAPGPCASQAMIRFFLDQESLPNESN